MPLRQALRASENRKREYGLNYSSDDDLSSLAACVEGQMASFVAKNA